MLTWRLDGGLPDLAGYLTWRAACRCACDRLFALFVVVQAASTLDMHLSFRCMNDALMIMTEL
jgi:hypothetical protein